eukprot:CAMPEP_0206003026 /NCGR_PEP_ID=MMETSP1464-20131121/3124_1 /ASSEMBLY_ACC=CAM_ASM_001124 /TAXON_ID=119497 /ORGANISM="Exanthemachrysis gayraliae, Strain RCC1523" /LENGTH=60 /DNA_ID=CAMNT_0053376385 /DNA_START=21 /DNA_END=200 /DNA_ORIENTATION=+
MNTELSADSDCTVQTDGVLNLKLRTRGRPLSGALTDSVHVHWRKLATWKAPSMNCWNHGY